MAVILFLQNRKSKMSLDFRGCQSFNPGGGGTLRELGLGVQHAMKPCTLFQTKTVSLPYYIP